MRKSELRRNSQNPPQNPPKKVIKIKITQGYITRPKAILFIIYIICSQCRMLQRRCGEVRVTVWSSGSKNSIKLFYLSSILIYLFYLSILSPNFPMLSILNFTAFCWGLAGATSRVGRLRIAGCPSDMGGSCEISSFYYSGFYCNRY